MHASGATRFLVDGFPRKLDQLTEFEARVRRRPLWINRAAARPGPSR